MVKSQKQILSREIQKMFIKKWNTKKDNNSKICKMSMGGNDTHKNKLVKNSEIKHNAKRKKKEKKLMLKKDIM